MLPKFSSTYYILGVLFAIAAIVLPFWFYRSPQIDIEKVLSGLHRIEASYRPFPQPHPGPLVLVGFGGCTDITVNGIAFLESLDVADDISLTPEDSTSQFELNSLEDIVAEFTQMFAAGAAAE